MQPYEYFEHTADIGLEARGKTLAEAFANAAAGLVDLLVEREGVGAEETREIRLAGEGYEDLLVEWLNELLFLFDSEGFVAVEFEIDRLSERELEARVKGEVFDPRRHRARRGVKAATYHQVSVAKEDGYRVRVILDV